jgi:hypothetical protein
LTNNGDRNIYAYPSPVQQAALSSEPGARHDLVSYPTLQRSITFFTRAIHKPLQKRIMGLLKLLVETRRWRLYINPAISD